MFGMPQKGDIDYSVDLELDLRDVQPSVAGPKRPQDRINLPELGSVFRLLLAKPVKDGGYGKSNGDLGQTHLVKLNGTPPRDETPSTDQRNQGIQPGDERNKLEMISNRPTPDPTTNCPRSRPPLSTTATAGSATAACSSPPSRVALTRATRASCSPPGSAKKAVERGLTINPAVKTSLAPGSRVVSDYLTKTGLQTYLDQLGFDIVGYGCTTCTSTPVRSTRGLKEAINKFDLVAASVLSGNRNFEARVHQNIKANFLMSPPLVVAFALAGRVDLDLAKDPLGQDREGKDVFLKDLWPSLGEIRQVMQSALTPEVFRKLYRDFADQNPKWNEISSSTGEIYQWDEQSDYIHEPPFFADFSMAARKIEDILDARPLGIFSATQLRRITSLRPARSSPTPRPGNTSSREGSNRKTSTATAAGAATILS